MPPRLNLIIKASPDKGSCLLVLKSSFSDFLQTCRMKAISNFYFVRLSLHMPAAVAEWVERLCSEREIPRSNPSILPLLSSACREHDGPPCRIHAYTVYNHIGGKGRCRTRHDLRDHRMQARKSAGERSTPDLKPVRKDTQSPKQEQSVALQTVPWSKNNLKKKKKRLSLHT